MNYLNEDDVRRNLPWAGLIRAIAEAVAEDQITAPRRTGYELPPLSGEAAGHLLIMPAWRGGGTIGIKTVTYRPDNRRRGERSHGANYLLIDGASGEALAVLDGRELTERRTAAVSALAARSLARADSRRLLVVGTGPVARNLALAHAASRDLALIEIYGRDAARAGRVVENLARDGVHAQVCEDLPASAAAADIISSATSAVSPVLLGAWLHPGVHVDLVGSFTPQMREVDDALMARADSIWVDTSVAAEESGDLVGPLTSGSIAASSITGDLKALLTGRAGARDPRHITVFKSVGFATPDLAAAQLALAGAASQPDAKRVPEASHG